MKNWQRLVKEASPSYSVQQMFKMGYKIIPTQLQVTTQAEAPFVPSLSVQSVSGHVDTDLPNIFEDRVTLLTLSFRVLGTDLSNMWRDAFEEEMEEIDTDLKTQAVHLSCYNSWLYRIVLKHFVMRSLRNSIDEDDQDNIVLCFDDKMEAAKKTFGISNEMTAYIFLVDSTGRIRWKASGALAEGENGNDKRLMIEFTKMLLSENKSTHVR